MTTVAGSAPSNARVYWRTWGVLLGITVLMLWVDAAALPRPLLLAVLLGAMIVKATLIAATFMHLACEHRGLILTVVVGLFVLAFVLYVLMVPDAIRIRDMVAAP